MPTREASVHRGYCLRGEIRGVEQVFPLEPGTNRLGSLANNEVTLLANGVSRLHARLEVVDGELRIEDLASKNGTFVGDRRVREARIAQGETVRFGPVSLVFQELHRDDAELAIAFEPAISEQTGTVPILPSPAAGFGGVASGQWLRLAELFCTRLSGQREGDLGSALGLLVEELQLDGACALELPEDSYPIVLAASGQVSGLADSELRRLCAARPASGPGTGVEFRIVSETAPPVTLVISESAGTDPLVLALSGEFPGRVHSAPLLRLLLRLLESSRSRVEKRPAEQRPRQFPGLVFPPGYVPAQSPAMKRIYRLMQPLATGDLPILIVGETGVGKEYLAQILHDSSPRRRGPYVAINCAAIPAELLEAELFGIGEGVATGVSAKEGRLQLADGGTLFLDEIGDMSADLQAKLLRALQEKEVHPVGRDPVAVDVRVLAATNQDLSQRIRDGSFRADLYYRLAGYMLEVPPLRQRPQDVPALVEHFLRGCARELGRPIRGLTVRALRLLCDYPWPGNVRELANEVRRAVYLCPENHTVESSILSQTLRDHEPPAVAPPADVVEGAAGPKTEDDLAAALGLFTLDLGRLERQAIEEALARCGRNQVQAAKLLGISRQSLRRRMERLGHLPPASSA